MNEAELLFLALAWQRGSNGPEVSGTRELGFLLFLPREQSGC